MALEFWDIAADRLRKSLGNNNYKSWIEPLQLVGESAGTAEFFVPTSFFGNYVRQHFEDQILYQMRESGFEVTRVTFSVGRLDQEPVARPSSPAVVAPVKPREIQGAKLDKRFVFDNFVVGKPNELAHAAAKRVAEAGPVTFNPLFLYGGVGLGKTHLMHSIAWELQSNRPDINVMYLSAEQFMYRFVQALRERKMMDFKELFRSVDVLMVDDVQFIGGKDSTQEEFFHTFNALVDQNKQIIISADRAPGEIKQLE
ncbi:MAG TPA: chromosomal replication initiator protein DnaA, partial [Planktomarina temperata]|nr:chromosomal replication initiator protein DnaA [Planktomarina temperata]